MMNSEKGKGVGLIKINNDVGVWYSTTMPPKSNVYVNMHNMPCVTLDEIERFYSKDQIKMIRYEGDENLFRMRLCGELLNSESSQDMYKNIINTFVLNEDVNDMYAIMKHVDNEDDDEEEIDEEDQVIDDRLSKIEKRLNQLSNGCSLNYVKNNNELFDRLLNCGFVRI